MTYCRRSYRSSIDETDCATQTSVTDGHMKDVNYFAILLHFQNRGSDGEHPGIILATQIGGVGPRAPGGNISSRGPPLHFRRSPRPLFRVDMSSLTQFDFLAVTAVTSG